MQPGTGWRIVLRGILFFFGAFEFKFRIYGSDVDSPIVNQVELWLGVLWIGAGNLYR